MNRAWTEVDPARSKDLVDARLQLHYAAQFATALGISHLTAQPDDSHTNLGWDPKQEALCSREVRSLSHSVRVAIRPRDLTLVVLLDGAVGHLIPLHGSTISEVESGLRSTLASAGLDARRLTLRRHYDLPTHPVAGREPFDANRSRDFAELAAWYANASLLLNEMKEQNSSSDVRCWPHHFDIATLATFHGGRSSGAGMDPGDVQYPEPYFYVNAYPPPRSPFATVALNGGGVWNTEGWVGAVLCGSTLEIGAAAQEAQVRSFLRSAYSACSSLLND